MTHDMPQAVASVEVSNRRGFTLKPDVRARLDRPVGQAPHVVGKPHHTVGIDSRQVGSQQAVRDDRPVLPRHADRVEDFHDERLQVRQRYPYGGCGHDSFPARMAIKPYACRR